MLQRCLLMQHSIWELRKKANTSYVGIDDQTEVKRRIGKIRAVGLPLEQIAHRAIEYRRQPFEQCHVEFDGGVIDDTRQLRVRYVDRA